MSDAQHPHDDPSAAGLRRRLRELAVFDVELPAFDPASAPERPEELFAAWLGGAIDAGVREPHALVLSTVDGDGRPDARTLILKGIADGGWEFATSRSSRKGRELEANPWAAAVFHWREQGRQVRLRGRVLDAGAEASARDFLARSPSARAETLAGSQSAPLRDPAEVETAVAEATEALAADPSLVAQQWALYRLLPDEVEFWQADAGRRHVRLQYRLLDGAWERRRLWP
ncbi:pyridoxal 5'-phosphate synthase [Conexibacter sp. JD483]|uniref:pyridoxine/pyridoxamine 5'-phosphate oxidase n=1 Tax=unclassified Conexibacter TaxID=2627773 RepID=UPI0027268000|nr:MULTISPECIES: pyridoxal 5'-phosphate synthase [unclassified Conexibacter]MDO8188649.1 pyridoxal 5'-phosphate synthase [Conexibacter sp. CPCC 205706]MDO8201515.1 pyridoxal 5'-phosphate synthase [Conexibacter sp. CPCC 205762]MDR9370734.1 pyridoxal 5'-phosphate synthase [Conexibacter sp. JD483]